MWRGREYKEVKGIVGWKVEGGIRDGGLFGGGWLVERGV